MRVQRHKDRTSFVGSPARPHSSPHQGLRSQLGTRGGEGWPGCTALIGTSAAGQGQLGGVGLYLLGHMIELWGDRQLYHQTTVVA